MVGFSLDKINILQHINWLFRAIVLAPGALDGMNTVGFNSTNYSIFNMQDLK